MNQDVIAAETGNPPEASGPGAGKSHPWPPLAWAAGLTLLLVCGPLLPAAKLFSGPAGYLPVHIILEFVVMAVSAMVFALGWNLRRQEENSQAVLLAAAGLGFALVDLAHTLSYQGMPDFITPSGPEKAINFWLAGRLMVALALLAAAILPLGRWPLSLCRLALGGSVATALLVWWAGLYHPDALPRTFIPGQGLTAFKVGAELVEAALFAAAAVILLLRARREGKDNLYWLAASAWILALAGLFFTLYRDVTDLFNLLGHIYMALAYVMVYRAVFVAGVAAPYEALAGQQALLHTLVGSLRKSEEALQAYQEHLEELVVARTRELEESRAEAERLSRVKGDFLANMSHEIRTPLNGILGLAQIGERQHADPKVKQSFRRILDSGEMLLGIINDILDFSKIEADKLHLEQREVDIGQLIDHGVDLLAPRAWSKGLDFRVEEAPDLPATCRGDALRLSQVLINLLANAIKFTERGRVTLRAGREGDTLVLSIADTGIGMNPKQIGRLFAPFEQADGSTTRRFGGTGLGLSICKRLMHLMGGEIRVDSEEGRGSRFEIRLPLADAAPPAPVPTDLVVLGRFSPFEARDVMGALAARGMKVSEAADDQPLPATAALVLTPAEALEDDAFRRELQALLAAGTRVAVVPACGQGEGGSGLVPGAQALQRPIRPRRVMALLSGPATVAPSASPLPRLCGLTLLAAEDNPVNRAVLEEAIAAEGARLVCLESGIQALERLERDSWEAYDLVITDIQMPDLDGYELARRLRETAPGLPVVGLTAHALAEVRDRCLEAGMVEHMAKPLDIDRLVEMIRRHSRRPALPAPAVLPAASLPAAPSRPWAPVGSSIDWPDLESRYKGRAAFIDKILGIALEHNGETPEILRAAARAGDLQQMAFLAHGLKATAGNLAAHRLHDLAVRAEQAARAAGAEAAELALELASGLEGMLAEIAACRPAAVTAP
jgi:signal transduction histidine kinase/CheY-like chemotaxis protein/HPt (histidine-containing phosphotransfer) domain-containing protein